MKLLKYSLNSLLIVSLCLFVINCEQHLTKKTIDLSHLSEVKKKRLVERIQDDVNKKKPFQGSLTHQMRCDTLLTLEHNISGALQEKSTPFTKSGDYHIAFPLLEQSAKINPEDALYYYSWLLLYYYRDYERALYRLNQYDNLTPKHHDYAWGENVNYLKGLSLKQLGRFDEAIKEFSKAILDEGDMVDSYAYIYRGISYSKIDSLNQAISDFDKAIELYDKCTAAYFWKAEVLRNQNLDMAIENYTVALDLLEKGYYRSDIYVELFDIPTLQQVKDILSSNND